MRMIFLKLFTKLEMNLAVVDTDVYSKYCPCNTIIHTPRSAIDGAVYLILS